MHCRQRWISATSRRLPPSDKRFSASCASRCLYAVDSSVRERQRRLGRLERFAGQRMRRAHELLLELRPQHVARCVQYRSASSRRFESLIATRLVAASASPITPRGLGRVALARLRRATVHLGRPVSGGLAGRASTVGRLRASAMAVKAGSRRL